MDSTQIVVQARTGDEGSCPYCRGAFAPGERLLVCEACQTAFHEECLRQELGRCSTLGCTGKRALPRAATTGIAIDVRARPPRAVKAGWSGARRFAFTVTFGASVVLLALVAAQFFRPRSESELVAVLAFLAAVPCAAVAIAIYAAPVAGAPAPAASITPVGSESCRRCAVSFAPGERLLACDGCGQRYHGPCLRRLGRCSGDGCTGRRAVPGRAPGG